MKGLADAMRSSGWRYDAATNGYRKGENWVSVGQAEAAFSGAVDEREVVPEQGLSETFAEIIVGAGLSE